jgi:hypothetical protein
MSHMELSNVTLTYFSYRTFRSTTDSIWQAGPFYVHKQFNSISMQGFQSQLFEYLENETWMEENRKKKYVTDLAACPWVAYSRVHYSQRREQNAVISKPSPAAVALDIGPTRLKCRHDKYWVQKLNAVGVQNAVYSYYPQRQRFHKFSISTR